MMLRTIRLDPSDTFIFDPAAEPGEWAVPGSFLFAATDPAALAGKALAAFRAGFLGVSSFGFSTLVVTVPMTADERAAAVEALAAQFVARLGAPDLAAARPAADEEIAFAESLAAHPEGTLIALRRGIEDGDLTEQFRTLTARDKASPTADKLHAHARAFTFRETDEADGIEEHVDLVGLANPGRAGTGRA